MNLPDSPGIAEPRPVPADRSGRCIADPCTFRDAPKRFCRTARCCHCLYLYSYQNDLSQNLRNILHTRERMGYHEFTSYAFAASGTDCALAAAIIFLHHHSSHCIISMTHAKRGHWGKEPVPVSSPAFFFVQTALSGILL